MHFIIRGFLIKTLILLDPVLSPVVYCCAKYLGIFRKIGIAYFPKCKKAFMRAKIFPIRDHFYEPLFQTQGNLVFNQERDLPGISINVEDQLALLKKISFPEELREIPLDRSNELDFYLKNDFFEGGEADCWYGMIRKFKPKRIIEVGSGHSTKLAVAAIKKNIAEYSKYTCAHICIEPYEQPWLEKLPVTVIRQKVETIPLSIFENLRENDILFIDSLHMIRPQGDVLFLYQSILPRLKNGVIVHIHDIYTPFEYPEQWLVKEIRFWNEQYLLEAFLSQNPYWKIELSCYYLFVKHYPIFELSCPLLSRNSEPGSFYMRKFD